MYYLRTKTAAKRIQFTVEDTNGTAEATAEKNGENNDLEYAKMVCSLKNKEDCVMCGA